MRNLSVGKGLIESGQGGHAVADRLANGHVRLDGRSMFLIFGHDLKKTDPVFWFMMQIAMLCGFLTSYPVNWWLLRAGLKESM